MMGELSLRKNLCRNLSMNALRQKYARAKCAAVEEKDESGDGP